MKLTNAQLMIPFVRTVAELKEVVALIASYGLKRGKNGLKIYMMCEVPSNVLLAKEFCSTWMVIPLDQMILRKWCWV